MYQDQATGLRQLFAQHSPQLVAFTSAGHQAARSHLLAAAAIALATQHQRVLLIDENIAPKNAASSLLGPGVTPPDLLRVLRSEVPLEAALSKIGELNLDVVLAARQVQSDMPVSRRLTQIMKTFEANYDYVLVDCAGGSQVKLSAVAELTQHLTVTLEIEGRGIMQAYAHIKRLAHMYRRSQMQVLVTSACNREAARMAFNNLRQVAKEHLGVQLHYLGLAPPGNGEALAIALDSALPRKIRESAASGFGTAFQGA